MTLKANQFKARLQSLADRITKDFDKKAIAPTLASAERGLAAIERVVGYCEDKANPTPLKERESKERLNRRQPK